ncbi:MAG: GMC family oxidoreductase N-terminal domain-containing protein, partial [Chloroflexota bacterium]|nr:GMC family oxidoreductase N-terminal domain-containing protein [Chloroflexota bacterium]
RAGLGSPMALINGKHAMMNLPKSMYVTTEQGDEVIVGKGLGGGTKLYAGAAFMPDFEMWRNWDIDLEPYVDEAKVDSWASQVPDEFLGPGARRMMEASRKVGLPMHPADKHVDWDGCRVGCNLASVGCPHGAKWEGTYAAREAVNRGAELLFNTKAEEVILENGVAVGLRATKRDTHLEVRAEAVVSSCGGWGSVPLAKNAGLDEAGSWFTGDPSLITFGFLPKGQQGNAREHQFAALYHDKENGCIFGSIGLSPFMTWVMQYGMLEGLRALKDIGRYGQLMTVFSKVHDDDQGWVGDDGSMSKTYTPLDVERQEYSWEMNRKMLIAAGCDPDDLHRLTIILGHPSGTVKIGKLLDSHCQSVDVPNLYFCDASVFPEALGMPPVLTLVCLAKYEADYLATVV